MRLAPARAASSTMRRRTLRFPMWLVLNSATNVVTLPPPDAVIEALDVVGLPELGAHLVLAGEAGLGEGAHFRPESVRDDEHAVGIAEDVVAGRHADAPLRAGKHHRLVPGDDLPPAVRVGGLRAAAEHGETILMEDAGVAGVAVDHRAARAELAGELARDVAE